MGFGFSNSCRIPPLQTASGFSLLTTKVCKETAFVSFFFKIKILVKFSFFDFENPVICSCSVCFLISNLCICACVKLATSNPQCFLNQNKQPPVSNSDANASKKKWVLSLAS